MTLQATVVFRKGLLVQASPLDVTISNAPDFIGTVEHVNDFLWNTMDVNLIKPLVDTVFLSVEQKQDEPKRTYHWTKVFHNVFSLHFRQDRQ